MFWLYCATGSNIPSKPTGSVMSQEGFWKVAAYNGLVDGYRNSKTVLWVIGEVPTHLEYF